MSTGTVMSAIVGAFGIVVILLLIGLLVIWIVLPFSIFSIKELIREAVGEQKRTNELLRDILNKKTGERTHPSQAGSEGSESESI